ncbi:hypothetical protein GOD82_28620 [Sinorhizobium medicae]|nr:hypothetical protein [Sinorhizobium medicae]
MAKVTLDPRNQTPAIIARQEAAENVKLGDAARDLLSIPIDELLEAGVVINWGEVERSVKKIVESMAKDTSPEARDKNRVLTSVAVVRSFWANFCNIPPFCAPRPVQRTSP